MLGKEGKERARWVVGADRTPQPTEGRGLWTFHGQRNGVGRGMRGSNSRETPAGRTLCCSADAISRRDAVCRAILGREAPLDERSEPERSEAPEDAASLGAPRDGRGLWRPEQTEAPWIGALLSAHMRRDGAVCT